MNKKDIDRLQKTLIAERVSLEEELGTVADRNSSASSGWEATSGKMEVDPADESEVADKLEELEDNSGIADKLEHQLNEVKAALERVDKGTYGICEACGKPIEIERLEANPSARISIKHGH